MDIEKSTLNRRIMERQHQYDAVKSCIYCGRRAPEVALHKEHIVPQSLGGRLILPDASCSDCGSQTHSYEGKCAFRLFGSIRAQYNFPSKRSLKDRAKKFTMAFDGARRKIDQHDYPGIVVTFVHGLPGILTGKTPAEDYSGGVAITTLPEFGERLNKLRAKYRAEKVEFIPDFTIDSLGKMLCKIAHAYVTAEIGHGNFKPFLLDIILNKPPPIYISHFVGGLRDQEMPVGNDLHEISIDDTGLGKGQYIVVRIQLFADRRLPVYYVVVGQ